jgi:hypothetical protein
MIDRFLADLEGDGTADAAATTATGSRG